MVVMENIVQGHGLNFLILNMNGSPYNAIEPVKNFDLTHGGTKWNSLNLMTTFINSIPDGKIVLMVVNENNHIPGIDISVVHAIGSSMTLAGLSGQKAWVVIGYKGDPKPAWVNEETSIAKNYAVSATINSLA
ncbi:hypothetical protein QZH41_002332 [Actinostola sp. cb2023]|nr:hypothetical protein QZH41_002332 [Actinostola sp. cb2023]